jgi:hypothetical protein
MASPGSSKTLAASQGAATHRAALKASAVPAVRPSPSRIVPRSAPSSPSARCTATKRVIAVPKPDSDSSPKMARNA